MINLENVSFRYNGTNTDAGLHNINLTITRGQVVLLCGESGCGKTTLTRLINGLIPNFYEGELGGSVLIGGVNINKQSVQETARLVGSVFQNPRSQFFTVDATSEIAFGCENMQWDASDIADRVKQVAHDFRVEKLLERNLFKLSGGEKQKIACASVAAPNPEILVLDEPSSNLDISAMRDLAAFVTKWKRENKTVIIAEHRLRYLIELADRVIYMHGGNIALDLSIKEFLSFQPEQITNLGLRSIAPVIFNKTCESSEKEVKLHNLAFKRDKTTVLDIPDASIPQGSITAVLGNNGAGKTTLARCLCGLEKKSQGDLYIGGEYKKQKHRIRSCYIVMQDVNHQLFTESVRDEVLISFDRSIDEKSANERVEVILSNLNLLDLHDRHPQSLSGGEKQRVAIACAIASEKAILLYDEPTSGLDLRHMKEVAQSLKDLQRKGITQLVITHDPELVACCCDYVLFMDKGGISWSSCIDRKCIERLRTYFSF